MQRRVVDRLPKSAVNQVPKQSCLPTIEGKKVMEQGPGDASFDGGGGKRREMKGVERRERRIGASSRDWGTSPQANEAVALCHMQDAATVYFLHLANVSTPLA